METIKLLHLAEKPQIYNNNPYTTHEACIEGKDGVKRTVCMVYDGFGKHLSAIDPKTHVLFKFNDWNIHVNGLIENQDYDVEVLHYIEQK